MDLNVKRRARMHKSAILIGMEKPFIAYLSTRSWGICQMYTIFFSYYFCVSRLVRIFNDETIKVKGPRHTHIKYHFIQKFIFKVKLNFVSLLPNIVDVIKTFISNTFAVVLVLFFLIGTLGRAHCMCIYYTCISSNIFKGNDLSDDRNLKYERLMEAIQLVKKQQQQQH